MTTLPPALSYAMRGLYQGSFHPTAPGKEYALVEYPVWLQTGFPPRVKDPAATLAPEKLRVVSIALTGDVYCPAIAYYYPESARVKHSGDIRFGTTPEAHEVDPPTSLSEHGYVIAFYNKTGSLSFNPSGQLEPLTFTSAEGWVIPPVRPVYSPPDAVITAADSAMITELPPSQVSSWIEEHLSYPSVDEPGPEPFQLIEYCEDGITSAALQNQWLYAPAAVGRHETIAIASLASALYVKLYRAIRKEQLHLQRN